METNRIRLCAPGSASWTSRALLADAELHRAVSQVINYVLLAIGSFIFMVPFYWMVTTSIKDIRETFRFPPTFIPQSFTTRSLQGGMGVFPLAGLLAEHAAHYRVGADRHRAQLDTVRLWLCAHSLQGAQSALSVHPGHDDAPVASDDDPHLPGIPELGWLDTLKPLIIPSFFGGGPVLHLSDAPVLHHHPDGSGGRGAH